MLRQVLFLLVPLLLGAVTGCHDTPPAVHYDGQQALAILTTALDAWKQGNAKHLSQQTPPIRLVDDDFRNGLQLISYRLCEPDALIQAHRDVEVELTLKNRQAEIVQRLVTYQVSLPPHAALLRSD